MSSLLPIRSEPSTGDTEPRVVELEGEDADDVFGALSSGTARRIVAHLHEEPRTQSDLAEAVDTSVQNVRYHLDKLEDAGLVEVVDTWYSSRGNEMKVYAPADGALVIAGDRSRADRVRDALSRLIGGIVAVAAASLVVGRLVREGVLSGGPGFGAGGANSDGGPGRDPPADGGLETRGDATTTEADTAVEETRAATTESSTTAETATGDPSTTATTETATVTTRTTETTTVATRTTETTTLPTETATTDASMAVTEGNATVDVATTAAGDPGAVAGGLPPEALFFLGGASVLAVVVGLRYLGDG